MSANQFDAAPSEYIAVDQASILLGISNQAIVQAVLANRFLKAELDARLRALLQPLPTDIPHDRAKLFNQLIKLPTARLDDLARTMTLFINHQAILCTTEGSGLRAIAQWCGRQDFIEIVRTGGLPVFERWPVLSSAPPETLNLYAVKVRRYLLGLLPASYGQRLQLRFPRNEAPPVAFFTTDDPDRETFLGYALIAARQCALEGPGDA